MILIVDNTQRKFRKNIRGDMHRKGIPCVLTDSLRCAEYMPTRAVFVTEDYLLKDAQYIAGIYSVPYVRTVYPEDVEQTAEAVFRDGISNEAPRLAHRRIRYDGQTLYFCGKPIALTRTEKLVVSLLTLCEGWTDSEIIAAYCMRNPDDLNSVAVHICNTNAKARRATGQGLILCRRFSGYSI